MRTLDLIEDELSVPPIYQDHGLDAAVDPFSGIGKLAAMADCTRPSWHVAQILNFGSPAAYAVAVEPTYTHRDRATH